MGIRPWFKWLVIVLLALVVAGVWAIKHVTDKYVNDGHAKISALKHKPGLWPSSVLGFGRFNEDADEETRQEKTGDQGASSGKAAAQAAVSSQIGPSGEASLSQPEVQHGSNAAGQGTPLLNPVLTDAQVLQIDSAQNQVNQKTAQIVAARQAQIAQVHQAIIESGVMASTSPKPFVAPLTVAPDDIMQRVKSHQLTAH